MTFDIDWADDRVIEDTIVLVEKFDVEATWFVTHKTHLLDRLRENPKFELGIHPNFNFLLDGDFRNGGNVNEILSSLKKLVPEAVSVRSHSMTQSSYLLDSFQQLGMTHDVNHFIPFCSGVELKPWVLWNGLYRIPYNWEDDLHMMYLKISAKQLSPEEIANENNKFDVFDFHPIHLFLNTESLDRYESTRSIHKKTSELIKHRYNGYGTRNLLLNLLESTTR